MSYTPCALHDPGLIGFLQCNGFLFNDVGKSWLRRSVGCNKHTQDLLITNNDKGTEEKRAMRSIEVARLNIDPQHSNEMLHSM